MARALSILIDLWLPLKWAANIKQALYARADDKIDAATTRIQNLARVAAARDCTLARKQAYNCAFQAHLEQTAAAAIQRTLARGPAARAATAGLAACAFKKYAVDCDELLQYATSTLNDSDAVHAKQHPVCYWAFVGLWGGISGRPRISSRGKHARKHMDIRVSWVKPKLLRDNDVERISQRPTKRTAFVVDCAFCGIYAAEKVCLDACADPYEYTQRLHLLKRMESEMCHP